ncbi:MULTISPECIES: hypothetical protein [unclassified Paenibacillus]|uniref:hypothetical protein n=1 Tax=unclassified Paenibacillus TaxID=185978 RepID=UPI0011425492|nr:MULTISPECIES: hypothetical protein [unclassified Paenibacillus]
MGLTKSRTRKVVSLFVASALVIGGAAGCSSNGSCTDRNQDGYCDDGSGGHSSGYYGGSSGKVKSGTSGATSGISKGGIGSSGSSGS